MDNSQINFTTFWKFNLGVFDILLKRDNTKSMSSKALQKGFSVILIIIGVLVVGFLVITVFKAKEIYQQKTGNKLGFKSNFTGGNCKEHPKFSVSPIKVEDLGLITPLGRMSDSHVTPTDHEYWAPKSVKRGDDYTKLPAIYDIYSPADGTIVQAENHTQVYTEGNAPKINDWRLVINHNCGVSTIYIHIDKLSDEIQSKIGAKRDSRNGTTNYEANIPVKEGQIIGKLAEHPFDFSMHDQNITLPGLNPKRYENEYWKIHTVDPFDYFADSIKSQLLTKVVRKVEPRGGKIDYDIPGKLVGTWFRVGYDPKNIDGRFWDAQMTIAYNVFDPSKVFISLGNFNGKAGQFAVAGNTPDPKDVGVGQLVKYEVVPFSYVDADGKAWNEDRYTPEVKLIPGKIPAGSITYKLKDKETLEVRINSTTQIYRR